MACAIESRKSHALGKENCILGKNMMSHSIEILRAMIVSFEELELKHINTELKRNNIRQIGGVRRGNQPLRCVVE